LRQHGREIVEGEHRVHARHRERRALVDPLDQRMRMRAAHESGVPHAGQRDVVDEAAAAAQQRLVFETFGARADGRSHAKYSECHAPRTRGIQQAAAMEDYT
jgi:hypothetical protein